MAQGSCCALCDKDGGASQDLTKLPSYRILVCQSCWDNALLGWPEAAEPALFQALAAQGLLIPDRNDHGRLPRDYAPPADFAL